MPSKPNVLFIMTDQQRFDTIAALGNDIIYTPNLDKLVRRGVSFTNAYSTCPVCVPARYTIRTGCDPLNTGYFSNDKSTYRDDPDKSVDQRCGPYLAAAMRDNGYRTFGIGKFHAQPWHEDLGYEYQDISEELYANKEQENGDAYASFMAKEHPEYHHIENYMGERTEMYYMPQMSALPMDLNVEWWAADRARQQLTISDDKPFFGLVSFIGPHPPCAPPTPFNRMYDPDKMTDPILGKLENDHADEQILFMNRVIWADDISDQQARAFKARYYGEISYIDHCVGRILQAVESRPDADNTIICFFADHGDHLGDHHAWQKESFFEQSCHIPMLVSWPEKITKNQQRDELVCLTDLFGIATTAAGNPQLRDGIDLLAMLEGKTQPREHLFGYYGEPGTAQFKIMVRSNQWKYIFIANGGRKLLFNMLDDPQEVNNLADEKADVTNQLHTEALKAMNHPCGKAALEGEDFKTFEYTPRPAKRIYQFNRSRNIHGFPEKPEDALKNFDSNYFFL